MPDKIPFGYEELVNAIANAIEMAEKKDGAIVVDHVEIAAEEKLDFAKLRAHAATLWTKLVGSGDKANPDMAADIMKKIEITMGRRMKLSEFTEDQVDLLALVVADMEALEKTQG